MALEFRPNNPMPSLRDALDALDWVRRELLRAQAPDQMRNGLRERAVQKLCAELIHGATCFTRQSKFRTPTSRRK